jgi:hypothetical protein
VYVINHHTRALFMVEAILTMEGVDCHCEETPRKVGWMNRLRDGMVVGVCLLLCCVISLCT